MLTCLCPLRNPALETFNFLPRSKRAVSLHQQRIAWLMLGLPCMELREDFIARVRHAIAWVNKNRADYLYHLCTCQKEWAQDVEDARGSRTKH